MDMSKSGETAIKMFYKYPLGFLFSGDNEMAQNVYNYIIKQEPNESARDFNTYYDCWLYLYTKFSNNINSNIHYQKILKNKSIFGGFGALPNSNPELRATAISSICSFLEMDITTFKSGLEFICLINTLNKKEKNFYFMLDENKQLIKNFPLKDERKYIFETKSSRPLLYSFSLASIALLCGYLFFKEYKYLYFLKNYIDKIIDNELHNDYCGKAIIIVSLFYHLSKDSKLLEIMNNLCDYILETDFVNGSYTHNGNNLSVDRLSEYEIGLQFYYSIKNNKLPDVVKKFLINLIK